MPARTGVVRQGEYVYTESDRREDRINAAAEVDPVFSMLKNSAVPPRRKFIQSHAREVQNLDV